MRFTPDTQPASLAAAGASIGSGVLLLRDAQTVGHVLAQNKLSDPSIPPADSALPAVGLWGRAGIALLDARVDPPYTSSRPRLAQPLGEGAGRA